ncbi:MAG TPA: FkbM family methyltransferase [Fimbriiglobus sp.]|nr:FkbM family methyltransferase [Fimbriiglobus sp.]
MGLVKQVVRAVVPRAVRNWARRPTNSARWLWADAKARLGRTDQLELRPGWVIRSHPGAYPFAYYNQVDDPEQVAEFDQFIRHCTPGMVLFDVGAHFGLYSLAAVHYGGSTARAVAVDPSPMAARVVRFQARANGSADRIRVVQASAGAAAGRQALVAAGIGSVGYYVAPTADHPPGERVEVECVSIDGLAEATGLAPTHVKIDVEGFELGVLRGGAKTFGSPRPPLLFLELHSAIIRDLGGDPRECLALIAGWGFEVRDVSGKLISADAALKPPLIRLLAVKPGDDS